MMVGIVQVGKSRLKHSTNGSTAFSGLHGALHALFVSPIGLPARLMDE